MSERWVPEPPPESNSYHDSNPPRCGTCRSILVKLDGLGYEGFCTYCKAVVRANYSFTKDNESD